MRVTCPVCGGSGETWNNKHGTASGVAPCRGCFGTGIQEDAPCDFHGGMVTTLPDPRIATLEASLAAAQARTREVEALLAEAVAALDDYCPADPCVHLDAEYDAFYAETGHWPLGRDRPAAMGGYDREASRQAWYEWKTARQDTRYKATRALLAKVAAARGEAQ